ncbi:Flavin-dependent oxidoreductase, luciferase family (includes alkanesulfonate monooxygenase SsuD and methylene tetrahydromethanopterin reductase) [Sanguibacter gelidistatuariae]|uniref:Flavin-dependent oxidoreductase, luciferase family (Includes alkanesulfonate monooxygenase SsuD and methylene tetrahydromethanopterin reductase) n=1 Tax=Sanguibacter gelidistatuariae TaxID=1814289 RepID=A0A1G6H990_9MICO|nr:LLM class flavin-dependent oxidoreductase [Sanguibacter gelidistatuariae]SDB90830.1 Flavin-dependent oxidoreductase, luciferase family (includes alkanesulfonate monooxygenase SsuD and methylene tetrahydromethanopterin reductase) [Sanguibacter gelidistatuariae]
MTDYGHDLLFGTFLTPSAAQPQAAVALTQVSEQAGLDLATFQDHPYQPAFLDSWTLLSYVAARTERIRLSLNVANLPLRQPAVLARSAASLDLLTGGRVELGLGAGAFWEAIEAMGASRLTPGQGVKALTEAIEIIRGIWADDVREPLRVAGDFHHVDGAKRGPAPAHDIGIWLGAYKPKMLALTGRTADGWLPSLAYLKPGDLTRGNTAIDAAATAAGRPPGAVRRLLNITGTFAARSGGLLQGPVSQWVAELTELALTEGMSGFILGTDDPAVIQQYGKEVAPAVREAVAAERQARVEREAARAVQPQDPASAQATGSSNRATSGADVTPAAAGSAPAAEPSASRLGLSPTPDDGRRLSSQRPFDEATRPHYTPPTPDAAYTDQGRAVGQHLIDVHDALRAELDTLLDVVGQVVAGVRSVGSARSEINKMTMRQNNWTLGAYCAAYCTTVTGHHSLEDASIFPHLATADEALEPVIDRLTAEHHTIHEVLEGVDKALVALGGDPSRIADVQEAVHVLADTLLSHLSYEEIELVEPLARLGFYPGQV